LVELKYMNFFIKSIFFSFLFSFIFVNFAVAGTFGIRPAFPRADNPRTESIFIQTINPGEFAEDGVKIINNEKETKKLLLYARDSVRSSGGGFACGQLSNESKGVGLWINFDISNLESDIEKIKTGSLAGTVEIEIKSGSEVVIPFLIKVPEGASVGEHNGCILIQEIKAKSEGSGVSLSIRSGIRVAVNIPGEIVKKINIEDFKIEKKDKTINFILLAKNTGNVSVDTNVLVSVKHFFGLKYKKFSGKFPVLRDEIYQFNFKSKKPFWGGLYRARATLSYDQSENAEIGTSSKENITKIESKTIWMFSGPTTLGLIFEIIIFLFLLFIFAIYRLHLKKKRWISKWVNYEVKEEDTLEKLSKEYRVYWQLIASVNKIKAPYILKEGMNIKLPQRRK